MTKKQQKQREQGIEYMAIGIVFTMLGLALTFGLNDTARVTGIPFFVLGITFSILYLSSKKGKKHK